MQAGLGLKGRTESLGLAHCALVSDADMTCAAGVACARMTAVVFTAGYVAADAAQTVSAVLDITHVIRLLIN